MAAELPKTRLGYLTDREADIMDVDASRERAGHACNASHASYAWGGPA